MDHSASPIGSVSGAILGHHAHAASSASHGTGAVPPNLSKMTMNNPFPADGLAYVIAVSHNDPGGVPRMAEAVPLPVEQPPPYGGSFAGQAFFSMSAEPVEVVIPVIEKLTLPSSMPPAIDTLAHGTQQCTSWPAWGEDKLLPERLGLGRKGKLQQVFDGARKQALRSVKATGHDGTRLTRLTCSKCAAVALSGRLDKSADCGKNAKALRVALTELLIGREQAPV